jgi:mono/diheme cytochrome c family protein
MRIIRWIIGILSVALAALASAAEIDTNKLPAAATVKANFDHDIRPILEQSCLRCHGPEKPKSHFRLTSREMALKGGDNNPDDIVPGDSGRSRLVHSVAGLVEDMQMPPPGKAEPLTPAQIGLLRAWIDQGAAWGTTNQFPQSAFSFSPTLRWIGVEGNKSKFREMEGVKEGLGGGVENFSMERQDSPDRKLSMEGHFLAPEEDMQLKLQWTKTDAGFVRVGFDEWRKYYVDTGGFVPPTNSFSLNRDLYLDNGRAWIDLGLTRPDLPQTVLGYEYQFKQGNEATLQWGAVDTGAGVIKNIDPASKHIDEHTHIIKLDSSYELQGWRLEDNARVEFYHLETSRTNGWPYVPGISPTPSGTIASVAEKDRHTQGANTFSVSKQLEDWWSVSSGYFYSRLDGNASLNQTTLNSAPVITDQWSAEGITLRRDSQVVSFGSLMGPWNGLTFSAGVQGEWTHQESSGLENFTLGFPGDTSTTNNEAGKFDSASARENLLLRYTKIPWTVLFAETRLRQESLHRQEEGSIESATLDSGPFTLNSDVDIHSEEYRAGFNTSPWRQLSLGASFKHALNHTDYAGMNSVSYAYPGFIQSLDTDENQIEARLVYRATSWLKTSFSFRWQKTDFNNAVFPVLGVTNTAIEAGNQEAHVYSVNTVLTPFRRLYLSSTFSYSDSRIATASDGTINGVVPWQGNVYTVMSSATFALNPKTDLHAAYVFSKSDYGQNNADTGLPAGINYERHSLQVGITRRFPKNLVTTLAYGFYQYHEPTSGNANDYTAQGIFATATIPWP